MADDLKGPDRAPVSRAALYLNRPSLTAVQREESYRENWSTPERQAASKKAIDQEHLDRIQRWKDAGWTLDWGRQTR